MKTEACGVTHKGNIRNHNEDNIYVDGKFRNDLSKDNVIIRSERTEGAHVFAVLDGLGGEVCGERASYIAAVGLKAMEERGEPYDIETFVSDAHRAILNESVKKDARNMGTTAVVMILNGLHADIYNVGDSRAYLYRNGGISQLTRDHTVLQSMEDNGFTLEDDNSRSKFSGELTQYLGMSSEEDVEPSAHKQSVELKIGDKVLLCSDGLTGELPNEDIKDIFDRYADNKAEHLTGRLVKAAVDGKCRDNVSAVVIRVD